MARFKKSKSYTDKNREKNEQLLESINENENEADRSVVELNAESLSEPKHKVINSLVGNLSHALEENISEMDDILEAAPQTEKYHDREKRPVKYRVFLVIGLLVFWLSIIGGIDVVKSVGQFAYDISNQTALRDELRWFIFPVVLNDPPEFASTDNLQPSTVIASAIWQIIFEGNTSGYAREMGMMTIPESDVEMAARSIFGTGFEISHRTIDYYTMAFIYDAEKKSYMVPENPTNFSYSPNISDFTRAGDIYTVTVEYILPTPLLVAGIEYSSEPVKTMTYTIKRTNDRVKTIQAIELDRERTELLGEIVR